MNSRLIAGLLAFGIGLQAISMANQDSVELKDQKAKASYGIGLNVGRTLKQQGLKLDMEALAAGIKDALTGGERLLTDNEIRDALEALQTEMLEKKKEQLETNKKDGEAFLAANKRKDGVQTLPSGLQYKVIRPGSGEKPKATDTVRTHYRGTLIDGTEFDSSYESGEPVSFQVRGVIPGWTEALQLMPVGAKWRLFVPYDLAYEDRGQGPIPPNSALVFDIELLGIERKD